MYKCKGNPLKRAIFHFAQMSTFLSLKCPFLSPYLSSQSAQISFAEKYNYMRYFPYILACMSSTEMVHLLCKGLPVKVKN